MKTISYYISMVVILAATIFTGCTDDDEKSLSPRAGELSIYDFAPNTGKGGTQLSSFSSFVFFYLCLYHCEQWEGRLSREE